MHNRRRSCLLRLLGQFVPEICYFDGIPVWCPAKFGSPWRCHAGQLGLQQSGGYLAVAHATAGKPYAMASICRLTATVSCACPACTACQTVCGAAACAGSLPGSEEVSGACRPDSLRPTCLSASWSPSCSLYWPGAAGGLLPDDRASKRSWISSRLKPATSEQLQFDVVPSVWQRSQAGPIHTKPCSLT